MCRNSDTSPPSRNFEEWNYGKGERADSKVEMCGGPFRAEEEEHVKEPASPGPLCMNASASYLSLQLQASQSPLTCSHYPPGMFFLSSLVCGV